MYHTPAINKFELGTIGLSSLYFEVCMIKFMYHMALASTSELTRIVCPESDDSPPVLRHWDSVRFGWVVQVVGFWIGLVVEIAPTQSDHIEPEPVQVHRVSLA